MVSRASLLIGSNLRKSKTRIAVVGLLCILAAALLNIVFILSFDYSENFYRDKEAQGGPDIVYSYADPAGTVTKDALTAAISARKGVKDVEVFPTRTVSAESEFGEGSILKLFTFYSESGYGDKRLDRFEITERDDTVTDGVYLGYIYKAAQNYKTGDRIALTIRGKRREYTVKGFYNNVFTGTVNCIDVSYILSDGLYEELLPDLTPAYRVSVICSEGADADEVTREISTDIADKYPGISMQHTQTVKITYNARYSNAKLFGTILLVSGILIIAILMIMIAIVLSDYVKSSTVNLGTLKAVGYTSASLISPILLEFGVIIAASSVIGIGASYAVFPLINRALESQIGIPYLVKFIPLYGVYTVLVTLFASILTVRLSIRKITHIEPINAIKVQKSNDKTNNILSLDRTNLGLNTAIGLKTCFSSFSRNFIISVCYLMVSFLIAFSCFLYTNVIMKTDDIIELVCGQVPDCSLSVSAENVDRVTGDLENDPDVLNYYQYTCKKSIPDTGVMLPLYLTEDSSHLNRERILIKGRLAENADEVAINKRYALDNGLAIGDKLTFTVGEGEVAFEIVGFTQGAYYIGNDGYMLVDGYRRIEDLTSFKYYVDLDDGCDIDAWCSSFKASSPISSATNEYKYFDSNAKLYKSILVILCIVIVVLSLLISCFVLYVLISILLENKRREHGILKSLGFVTRDVVYQVILGVLPFAFLATVVGTFLSKKLTGPILSSLLNSIGIFDFGKEITFAHAALCVLLLTVFTVVYTVLSSSSVKKITPHELFNKE